VQAAKPLCLVPRCGREPCIFVVILMHKRPVHKRPGQVDVADQGLAMRRKTIPIAGIAPQQQ
jgi:hypothetical protein